MRKMILLLALCLAGCAPATFKSPVTGATITCSRVPLADINPWQTSQLCMESAVSEGYQRVR